MAVVINEFEVLNEPSPATRPEGSAAAPGNTAPAERIQPQDIVQALRSIEQQALRVWAH